MLCTKCSKDPAIVDPILGVIPYCKNCQNTLKGINNKTPEFVGEQIKENRQKYKTDIIPHHYKGHLNKEWLESKYGGVDRAKKEGYNDKEIKEAQYVYSGNLEHSYYKKY